MRANDHISPATPIRPSLSEPSLQRMPWYLAYVSRLQQQGAERVSTTRMAKELNVDASQIAKDLASLNVRGKTRIGYDVAELHQALNDVLGFDTRHKAIIFGVGSLGAALVSDRGLMRYGLDIIAGFDTDPAKLGTLRDTPIYHTDSLPQMVERLHPAVAILAVPPDVAQTVADKAVDCGIRALWNFTPHRLAPRPNVVIQDTSIYAHLAVMYHRMKMPG